MSEGAWVESKGMRWDEDYQAWEEVWESEFSLDLPMTTAADCSKFTRTSGTGTLNPSVNGAYCTTSMSPSIHANIYFDYNLGRDIRLNGGWEIGCTLYAPRSSQESYSGIAYLNVLEDENNVYSVCLGDFWDGSDERIIEVKQMNEEPYTLRGTYSYLYQPLVIRLTALNQSSALYINNTHNRTITFSGDIVVNKVQLQFYYPYTGFNCPYIKNIYLHRTSSL